MVIDKEATLISSTSFRTTSTDSSLQDTMNPNLNLNQYQYQQNLDSGSESAFIGSWGSSSSSILNTSLGSELDSNDTDSDDNDEFIAELTRRMADYMLQEDEDGDEETHSVFEKPTSQQPTPTSKQNQEQKRSYADTLKKSLGETQASQIYAGDQKIQAEPAIELYQVENQPRVGRGRRGKKSESTQQMKPQQQFEHIHGNRSGRAKNSEFVNGGKGYPGPGAVMGPPGQVGSGMRAIFLGGSGSRNPSSGTGVFLPRSAADATDHRRKKPGCSTVLIPTRVLQALEQHFNNMESLSSSNGLAKPRSTHHGERSKMQQKSEVRSAMIDELETNLPQEWIY